MLFCAAIFFGSGSLFAQSEPKVTSFVDTTFIKIGEQIRFDIHVEMDSTAQVIFPEGQTFSPLEMVESFAADTVKKADRLLLQKSYLLTQFDSGVYVVPRQRIAINEQPFFTDSLQIAVATVPVDTLTQKMYDIKPLVAVDKPWSDLWWILLWVVLTLLVLGALVYWFVFRKKPLSPEEKEALLPPFDRALLELKRLENSKYLIQDEYKQYYSELTDIVRSYLEEDVHVSALESTTDQLITKLELMKDAGELKLEEETINQFKKVLMTSDLVKFAKSKPEMSAAEEDRKAIEQIVIKTKEALPEPTEEEISRSEEYQMELAKKKQRKKVWLTAAAAVAAVLVLGIAAGAYYGFAYVKDTVLGHPTKELLEGEWISSTYGFPPITLETPQVLLRQQVKLSPEDMANFKEIQAFMYRSSAGLFTVAATSATYTQPVEAEVDKAIEQVLKGFEAQGAKNIITKQEAFSTLSGVKGLKIYGSGQFATPTSKALEKGQYTILFFGGNGFQQQVILTWLDGDSYAEEMVERILRSVDVKLNV
ncbi:hypothetical protein [Arenibacter sp. GZD-96]|uniref:hypothetical protein n=1 Tax=Aurantibrevibacter litoralis TaxID=3106030 RepID=UPI003A4D1D94